MFDEFKDKFTGKNCESCKDYYGHGRDKYQKICPIYNMLLSAMHGIGPFPDRHIDKDKNECRKNYIAEKAGLKPDTDTKKMKKIEEAREQIKLFQGRDK